MLRSTYFENDKMIRYVVIITERITERRISDERSEESTLLRKKEYTDFYETHIISEVY